MKKVMRGMVIVLISGIASGAMAGKMDLSAEAIASAHQQVTSSVHYVEYAPYSKTVPFLLIGYAEDGTPEQGVAMRRFKTYEWVTALAVVKKSNGQYIVSDATIPDIGLIKDEEKQNIVLASLRDIKNRIVHNGSEANQLIDSVTGATRYHKRIYLYYDKLSEALVSEMQKPMPATAKPMTSFKTKE